MKEEANEKKIQNTFQIGLLSIITQKISVIRMLNTKIEKNINILAIHECINKKRTRIDRSGDSKHPCLTPLPISAFFRLDVIEFNTHFLSVI